MTVVKREKLGSVSGFGTRTRVYLVPDALEVDEFDHYMVTRKRVFFEDVVLMTRHQRRPIWGALLSLVAAVSFLAMAVAIDETVARILFLVLALPFVVTLALCLFVPEVRLTVFGRRSKAELRFWPRVSRADLVWRRLVELIRGGQRKAAAEIAASAPAPAQPLGPAGPEPLDAPPPDEDDPLGLG